LPALTPGTKGADAELVYVKNGQLRHVRFTEGTSTAPSVIPGTFNMQEVSAARVE